MAPTRLTTAQSLMLVFRSWRVASNALLSLSSGMPLGLIWLMVPSWLTLKGVDIKTVGILSLIQAPWGFKFLWSPLMDRYRPKFLGDKRGWIVICQVLLAASTGLLAAWASNPTVGMVTALGLLIAFASASQDVAIDAYAVESLRPEEHGAAVGSRVAFYRVAMWWSGNIAISLGPVMGWETTIAIQAVLYLALVPVTFLAPRAEVESAPPKSLREAAWLPFVGFAQRPRSLEIIGFLLLYKLADNLAQTLQRPFLLQVKFDPADVGVGTGVVTLIATVGGTFLGGLLTGPLGVGRALWLFGFLQAISNLGYAIVAQMRPDLAVPVTFMDRSVMYVAMAVEAGTSGMGTGAFNVLLLRLTEKRFSATQYALLSSIFGLGRLVAGPIAGIVVDSVGWRSFFLFTLVCAAPGLFMLQRFVPWGSRDIPEQEVDSSLQLSTAAPLSRGGLVARASLGLLCGTALAMLTNALLAALKAVRGGARFDLTPPLQALLHPATPSQYIDAIGSLLFGLVVALGVAAYVAARRGPVTALRTG